MKRYCRKCKYYWECDFGDGCSYVVGYEDTYFDRFEITPDPKKQNKNNNCEFFKESLVSKLLKLIFKA